MAQASYVYKSIPEYLIEKGNHWWVPIKLLIEEGVYNFLFTFKRKIKKEQVKMQEGKSGEGELKEAMLKLTVGSKEGKRQRMWI